MVRLPASTCVSLFILLDPCSTEYELIYTSETFDDVSDICPSLLAYIKTFKDMDTQLRLSIYYNSSITGSKVIPPTASVSLSVFFYG